MKTGLLNKKLIIASGAAILAVCFLILGAAMLLSSPKIVFLGNEYDGKTDALQFTENAVSRYFKDRVITLRYNDAQKPLPAQDILSTDTEKTAEKIADAFKNHGIFRNKNSEVTPVMTVNEDAVKTAVTELVEENAPSADFYTVSQDLTSVSFNFDGKNSIPDIDATVKEVCDAALSLKFHLIDVLYTPHPGEEYTDYICSLVNKKPVDATLSVENGKEKITDEQPGFNIDKNELSAALKDGKTVFTVKIAETLAPEVTAKSLQGKKMFGEVLSSLSSNYNAGDVNRSKNIAIAASKINGYIMQPGDVFSYNAVVGARTYANGFKDAGVYTANGVESGVGGGICQVSSTLYGAQLMADLKTVTRTNHSYTVSYLPAGQDATVSYGSIDYKFKNSLDFPVKIECSASGGVLTVKFLGIKTDSYRQIKLSNETVGTTPAPVTERENASLAPGQQKVVQSGQGGKTVNTYKLYYKNGALEKREFVHKSVYIPMPRIIEVAPKAAQQPEPEQPVQPTQPQPDPQPEQPETPPAEAPEQTPDNEKTDGDNVQNPIEITEQNVEN